MSEPSGAGSVGDSIASLGLIDHHCHGLVRSVPDRAAFEDLINEGFDPPPAGTSHFDSPIGLAIRRWCAPALDLLPLASPEAYLARREELGAEEVTRRLLRGSGLGELIVESGYRSSDVLGPAEMADVAGVPAHEVVRLEEVAESVAEQEPAAGEYPERFRAALWERTQGAVGLKTIVAYRGGFAFDPAPPDDADVVDAAKAWFRGPHPARWRIEDPTLLRFGIWSGVEVARERRLPLQIHAGWGDPDLKLHLADPALLTDLVKEFAGLGVDVVFLHCYPYHRQAAYLAAVLPNVYFDVGEAITYTGTASRRVLAEALELAPFTKQLYSSDAFGLPELYHLGAAHFRRGMASILGRWIEDEGWSLEEALRIATLIGRENARRIYPLGGGDGDGAVRA